MSECESKQFDLFIKIILNVSFYLGFVLLIIMVSIGLYFFIFHCFWKPYSKRFNAHNFYYKIKPKTLSAARKGSSGSAVVPPLWPL